MNFLNGTDKKYSSNATDLYKTSEFYWEKMKALELLK